MAQPPTIYRATATAPVNIAVVKYWGKRDKQRNLPTNSSLSVTLSQDDLRALTTASCSPSYPPGVTITLDGKPEPVKDRAAACLRSLQDLRRALEAQDPSLPRLSAFGLRIVSQNNFPTAAGLASSAAGFAALVTAVAHLYELPCTPSELSKTARVGSGSACRSMLGGYVAWRAGELPDGSDSFAEEVAPAAHWPGMRALILVVSDARKDTPSTEGMQATVATAPLFGERARSLVPRTMRAMEDAISRRDFAAFAELTMRDSNDFHAQCLDTWPPIFYMNDTSRAAVRLVHRMNEGAGRTVCAYTFDAGPNAVIYYPVEEEKTVLGTFRSVLPDASGWEKVAVLAEDVDLPEYDSRLVETLGAGISRVIATSVGDGPRRVDTHLVDEHGEPVAR
ncbi:diphosphomevalonate decarboxylase [Ascosphaera acerosa]|nr:diphosphomevalonate decarboxylase [Ascosphaera acerosa]